MLCARVLTSRRDWAWVSMINVELHRTFMLRSSWTGAMLWWYWVALKAALCWAEECAYISWYHQQELNTKLLLRSSGTFCLTWEGRLRPRCLALWMQSLCFKYSVRALGLWQYGWYVVTRAWEISQVYKVFGGVCRFCATNTRLTQELRLRVWGRYCYSL